MGRFHLFGKEWRVIRATILSWLFTSWKRGIIEIAILKERKQWIFCSLGNSVGQTASVTTDLLQIIIGSIASCQRLIFFSFSIACAALCVCEPCLFLDWKLPCVCVFNPDAMESYRRIDRGRRESETRNNTERSMFVNRRIFGSVCRAFFRVVSLSV